MHVEGRKEGRNEEGRIKSPLTHSNNITFKQPLVSHCQKTWPLVPILPPRDKNVTLLLPFSDLNSGT